MDNEDLESFDDLETINCNMLKDILKSVALNQEKTLIQEAPDLEDDFGDNNIYEPLVYNLYEIHFKQPIEDNAPSPRQMLNTEEIHPDDEEEAKEYYSHMYEWINSYNSIDENSAINSFRTFSFKNLNFKDMPAVKIPLSVLKGLYCILKKNYEILKQNPNIVEKYPYLFFDAKINLKHNLIALLINLINRIDRIVDIRDFDDTIFILKKQAFENTLTSIQKLLLMIEKIVPSPSYDGLLDEVANDFQKTIIEINALLEQFRNIERTKNQREETAKLAQETEKNLKKSQEALTYSIKSAYSVQQQKLLQDKKCLRKRCYNLIVIFAIVIWFINDFVYLNMDFLKKLPLNLPFIFLLYVIFRIIRQLDKSIEHYEHKLSTNELLKIYLSENENFKDKAMIEQSILNVVTLKPDNNNSSDDSLIPYLKELKEFIKTKDKT